MLAVSADENVMLTPAGVPVAVGLVEDAGVPSLRRMLRALLFTGRLESPD